MKKVTIEEAVGHRLGHDLTEIKPGKKIKHTLFRRGHLIAQDDLEALRDIGKNVIYIESDNMEMVHEEDAAKIVAPLAAGEFIRHDTQPVEGKINFYADQKGLLKIDVDRLNQVNALQIPSLPTLYNNTPVVENQVVAAFRIIPLMCENEIIQRIKTILTKPIISIAPYKIKTAGIIVTGNEVYEGRIEDDFVPVLSKKLQSFQVDVKMDTVLPDKREHIRDTLKEFAESCDLILITGGTSVDPDDQTVAAMREAGVTYEAKGNPIQPGNNFTMGKMNQTTVCAIPAATLHFRATALDVFLPRILAKDIITKKDIANSGHGGLCLFCRTCRYPVCPFSINN